MSNAQLHFRIDETFHDGDALDAAPSFIFDQHRVGSLRDGRKVPTV